MHKKNLVIGIIFILLLIPSTLAAQGVYSGENTNPWGVFTNIFNGDILQVMFMFVLFFAIFALLLEISFKSRLGYGGKTNTLYVIAGAMAAMTTYYSYTNEGIWALWLGLFTGGLFLVSIFVVIFFFAAMVLFAGGHAGRGWASMTDSKSKVWAARSKKEEYKAEYNEKLAERYEKQENKNVKKALSKAKKDYKLLNKPYEDIDRMRVVAKKLIEDAKEIISQLNTANYDITLEEREYARQFNNQKKTYNDILKEVELLKEGHSKSRTVRQNLKNENIELKDIIKVENEIRELFNLERVEKKDIAFAERSIFLAEQLCEESLKYNSINPNKEKTLLEKAKDEYDKGIKILENIKLIEKKIRALDRRIKKIDKVLFKYNWNIYKFYNNRGVGGPVAGAGHI